MQLQHQRKKKAEATQQPTDQHENTRTQQHNNTTTQHRHIKHTQNNRSTPPTTLNHRRPSITDDHPRYLHPYPHNTHTNPSQPRVPTDTNTRTTSVYRCDTEIVATDNSLSLSPERERKNRRFPSPTICGGEGNGEIGSTPVKLVSLFFEPEQEPNWR